MITSLSAQNIWALLTKKQIAQERQIGISRSPFEASNTSYDTVAGLPMSFNVV